MGKPNWSLWTAPQPSSSQQLSRWQFWVETETELFQLFSSGSPLPDRHQGLWAIRHSLHAALRRQKNRQCLWAAGHFQSWPFIYYTYQINLLFSSWTTSLKSSLMVVTTSRGLGSSSSTIIICALTISSFLLIIFTTIMATGTLGDLPPQRLHQELCQHRSLSTGLFLSIDFWQAIRSWFTCMARFVLNSEYLWSW